MKNLILLILFIFAGGIARAQFPVPKTEQTHIFYKGKRYKVKSNWLTIGAGKTSDFGVAKEMISAAIDYNFYWKKGLWKFGYYRNGNLSYYQNSVLHVNDLHVAYGFRNQTTRRNLAAFAGISRISGIDFNLDKKAFTPFKTFGVYADIEAVRKITYDVGIGISLYGNYNVSLPLIGIRLDLYFSNAYKEKFKEEQQY